jgi:hypothetical protein
MQWRSSVLFFLAAVAVSVGALSSPPRLQNLETRLLFHNMMTSWTWKGFCNNTEHTFYTFCVQCQCVHVLCLVPVCTCFVFSASVYKFCVHCQCVHVLCSVPVCTCFVFSVSVYVFCVQCQCVHVLCSVPVCTFLCSVPVCTCFVFSASVYIFVFRASVYTETLHTACLIMLHSTWWLSVSDRQ